ncbi:proline iminopeptidase domain protein, partial [Chlamydia psittaci 01DC11]
IQFILKKLVIKKAYLFYLCMVALAAVLMKKVGNTLTPSIIMLFYLIKEGAVKVYQVLKLKKTQLET